MSQFHWQHITSPTVLIDSSRGKRNIRMMQDKAIDAAVQLRPHFKTHQSVDIGRWFRDAGTHAIAVSSVRMAQQFERAGWRDIMLAIPLNPRELSAINRLAGDCTLTLTIEHEDALQTIARLNHEIKVVVEVDAGYGRTGIDWQQGRRISELANAALQLRQVQQVGLMLHAGNSYQAEGDEGIAKIHQQSLQRLATVRQQIAAPAAQQLFVSAGDTPTCSRMQSFPGVDEIRPGNYVFYDLQQQHIGACNWDQLALTIACPVIARYPERGEVVIHGGAVHLSKDYLLSKDRYEGRPCYGQVMQMSDHGWHGQPVEGAFVHGLSQEHGKVRMPKAMIEQTRLGDLLVIAPAHSCLTMAAMQDFVSIAGQR
ncbi:MAG: alanine racemase [Idiomarina sp.]|nr:alanine racemase [Idiomarina sp.]